MKKLRVFIDWLEDFAYAAYMSFFLPSKEKEDDQ